MQDCLSRILIIATLARSLGQDAVQARKITTENQEKPSVFTHLLP
jgi:hypothetical protein